MLVKKPEDAEIIELVDAESNYPESQSSMCAASPVYRCPYRRYKDSIRRKVNVEFLSEDALSLGRNDHVELLELVDPDGMYPEARYSECTAPQNYRCAYRQYNPSHHTAQVAMLQMRKKLLMSQSLRSTPKLSTSGSCK